MSPMEGPTRKGRFHGIEFSSESPIVITQTGS
jgi:hypothetical protein